MWEGVGGFGGGRGGGGGGGGRVVVGGLFYGYNRILKTLWHG